MGGTKIVVLQLRQIIRTLLFVAVGIAIIGLLIYFLIPKSGNESGEVSSLYMPGTYYAPVTLKNDSFNVNVTVDENEILAVGIGEMLSTQEVFYPLIKPAMETLSSEIVNNQTANIPIPADYQETSKLLLQAVKSALAQADPKLHIQ